MQGDLSRLRTFVWPHQDDPTERLLLDPIPQEEMNQIMLRPMMKAGPGYWLTVVLLALVVAGALFGYWFHVRGLRFGPGMGLGWLPAAAVPTSVPKMLARMVAVISAPLGMPMAGSESIPGITKIT